MRLGLLTILGLLMALPVWADFNDGLESYQQGDFETALKEWLPLAEEGDAEAQSRLGYLYASGQGVAQDYAKAVDWFRLAAEQDHANGQYSLGVMYRDGMGVPQDYAEAVNWFRLAAEQEEAMAQAIAQRALGAMYYDGHGVPKDYVRAYMWWYLAVVYGEDSALEWRDLVAEQMTFEEITEAQRLAREWMEAHQ